MVKKIKTRDAADSLREAIRAAHKADETMTLYKIAKLGRINLGTLSRFMAGERDMRFGNVCKVMAVLNLDIVKRKGGR